MDFKGQPFVLNLEFFLQFLDKPLADKTKWSDIIGIDREFYWFHGSLLKYLLVWAVLFVLRSFLMQLQKV